MNLSVTIKGDLRGIDPQLLEGYLRALVEAATGRPVARVVYHGVLRASASDVARSFGHGAALGAGQGDRAWRETAYEIG